MFSNYWPRTLPLGSLHRGYKIGILNCIYINATSCTTINRRKSDKFSLQFRIKVLTIKNLRSTSSIFIHTLESHRKGKYALENSNFFLSCIYAAISSEYDCKYLVTTYVCTCVCTYYILRDVSAGATGATAVAPKFSDALTLSQPGGEDSAHHRRGRI